MNQAIRKAVRGSTLGALAAVVARPFLQVKSIMSDNSEIALMGGIRF